MNFISYYQSMKHLDTSQKALLNRRVQFNLRTTYIKEQVFPIDSVCSLLGIKIDDPYIGCLKPSGQADRVLLRMEPVEQAELHIEQLTTLDNLAMSIYSRDKRLEVVLMVLHTMLSLSTLPGVPSMPKKTQIILHRTDRDSHSLQPHNSHESFKATLVDKGSPSSPEDKATKCMFTFLGVLLPELLFREAIEYQAFWSHYLDGTGQPNEYTDLCAAMHWQKKVEGEYGSMIAGAIRRCIACSFEPPPDLASPSFIRAVWRGVGVPLQEFLKVWRRDPLIECHKVSY